MCEPMRYTGHLGPRGCHHVVVRGDLTRREFVAFWIRRPLDRTLLGDPDVPLTALVPVERRGPGRTRLKRPDRPHPLVADR